MLFNFVYYIFNIDLTHTWIIFDSRQFHKE